MINNFKQFIFVYGTLTLVSFGGSALATYLISKHKTETIIKTIELECQIKEAGE
jgi:hypothetical protein